VALAKKDVERAEQVLREIDIWKHDTNQRSWPLRLFAQPMLAKTVHEQSIAAGMLKIMDNIRVIASASTTLISKL
jgi:hypothetical protein